MIWVTTGRSCLRLKWKPAQKRESALEIPNGLPLKLKPNPDQEINLRFTDKKSSAIILSLLISREIRGLTFQQNSCWFVAGKDRLGGMV